MSETSDNHVLCRLEAHRLHRENEILRKTVEQLQHALEEMWRNEVVPSMRHTVTQGPLDPDCASMWRFYHEQKDLVREDLGKRHRVQPQNLSWAYVKKETDRLWKAQHPPDL